MWFVGETSNLKGVTGITLNRRICVLSINAKSPFSDWTFSWKKHGGLEVSWAQPSQLFFPKPHTWVSESISENHWVPQVLKFHRFSVLFALFLSLLRFAATRVSTFVLAVLGSVVFIYFSVFLTRISVFFTRFGDQIDLISEVGDLRGHLVPQVVELSK